MKKYIGILIAAVVCFMMALAVQAEDAVVYVNDGGTGDGSSQTSPLGSMSDAIAKVASGGKIVIVDTYTCPDEYYEPEHSGDIVVTGGKYIFTNGQYNRWFLSGSGSTTFENIVFEYGAGSTSLFIAQYHELIIGEGVTLPEDGKCYVVGGYQVPFADAIDTSLDSHVTIKSGNIWAVSGFNRGAGEVEFTGTSHITVTGGTIATVYGASINGNYSGSSEINITGGQINNVRAAGDATRRLNGNSIINISGGTIGLLSINNVMGTATVNYTGGNIAQAEKTVEAAIQDYVTDGTATLNASTDVDVRIISLFFDNVNYIGGGTVTTPEATTNAPAPETTTEASSDTEPDVTTPGVTENTSDEPEDTSEPESSNASSEKPELSDSTTEASKDTTKDIGKTSDDTTPAASTPAPSGTDAENGGNIGLIIGIVAAVVIVAIIVVVILKKKKK